MKDTVLTCSLCAETRPVAQRLFAFCPECGKDIRRAAPVPHVEATLPPSGPFVAATVLPEPVTGHAMVVPPPTVATKTTTDRRATGIRRTAIAATVAAVVAAAASGAAVWKMGTPDTSRVAARTDTMDTPNPRGTTGKADIPDPSGAAEQADPSDPPSAAGGTDAPEPPRVTWKTYTPSSSTEVQNMGELVILRTFTQNGKRCAVVKETYHKSGSGQTVSEEHTRCVGADGAY